LTRRHPAQPGRQHRCESFALGAASRGTAPPDEHVLLPVGGVGLNEVVVAVVGAHLAARAEVAPVHLERPGDRVVAQKCSASLEFTVRPSSPGTRLPAGYPANRHIVQKPHCASIPPEARAQSQARVATPPRTPPRCTLPRVAIAAGYSNIGTLTAPTATLPIMVLLSSRYPPSAPTHSSSRITSYALPFLAALRTYLAIVKCPGP
jgi:hypothetical protein